MKTEIDRDTLHYRIYLFSLTLLVCCLPLSRYLLSISQFMLLLNWLAEAEFGKKLKILRGKPAVLLFISIFLVYLAGLFYTDNLHAGLVKIKNVLPLVLLPVVMSTSRPISKKNCYQLFMFFVLAVSLAATICLFAYLSNPAASSRDFRKISLFIPHIRFALLIILAIIILFYQVVFRPFPITRLMQTTMVLLALCLVAFLFVLRSFAGIVILFILASFFVTRTALLTQHRTVRYITLSLVLLVYALVVFSVAYVYFSDFTASAVDPARLDKKTVNGNAYEQNPGDRLLENGNYVNLYVCEPELRKEWNARSLIPYDSADFKGQPVRNTLMRYLTSKGLRKDSAALSQLTMDEIHAIERGRANYFFKTKPGLYQRLYETLWEIHVWRRTGFVSYHSFGQRIVFLQTAGKVIRNNFFTGVGTGDVYNVMMKSTPDRQRSIERRWKGEPHNQYAFFLMAFGIFGFVWIMVSWIYPVLKSHSYRYLLFNLFSAIMLISMTVLDTIESYDNMVFFAFFYSLFVFGLENSQKNLMTDNDHQAN